MKPKAGWLENVMQMSYVAPGDGKSPVGWVLEQLNGMDYAAAVVHPDLDLLMPGHGRPRHVCGHEQ